MVKTGCDNTSVGVLITGDDGRYLMSVRVAWPAGVAPAAGHVWDWDRHGSYPDAARAMVAAELRLSITSQELTRSEGWQADRCGRTPGPHGAGHQWQVYAATVAGRLDPPRRRVRRPRWLDVSELERLARRTADYARGEISDSQFYARPGIQPVWVGFLAGLGIIGMAKHDLAAIECVAQAGGRR